MLVKILGENPRTLARQQLEATARESTSPGIAELFTEYVDRLHASGYTCAAFRPELPRLDRPDVYFSMICLCMICCRLTFLPTCMGRLWLSARSRTRRFSKSERSVPSRFAKLLEFDRAHVRFGSYAAPIATWYINERCRGDHIEKREAVTTDDFVAWLYNAAFYRPADARRRATSGQSLA
jgi:hypothetical protein